MNHLFSLNTPLQQAFWANDDSYFKQFILILAGVIILALATNMSIPLQPVPLTFQSAAVVLIGMVYGARSGAYVIGAYLLVGLLGMPVFSNFGFGITQFFGPTGGYLLGFLPAVLVTGYLAEKGWTKHVITSFLTACIGTSIIFLSGVTGLANFIGWHEAVMLGVMPFIISEPVKLVIVSLLAKKLWEKQ